MKRPTLKKKWNEIESPRVLDGRHRRMVTLKMRSGKRKERSLRWILCMQACRVVSSGARRKSICSAVDIRGGEHSGIFKQKLERERERESRERS